MKRRPFLYILPILFLAVAVVAWGLGNFSIFPPNAFAEDEHDEHEGEKHDEHAEHDEHEGETHDEHAEHDEHEGETHDEHAEHDEHEGETHDEHAEHDEHEGETHDEHAEHDEHEGETHDEHAEHDEHKGEAHDEHAEHDEHEGETHEEHAEHSEHEGEEKDEHEGHGHEERASESAGVIRLSEEDIRDFGIKLVKAGPGRLDVHVNLPGEIVLNKDKVAHVGPRFGGVVRSVRANLGDKVYKGKTLATVESNESLQYYALKAPISGIVIEKHISPGEVLGDDAEPFVVADLSTLWVDLRVYQKDLPFVKTGQKAHITAGPGHPEIEGTISYLSQVIDSETRTVLARLVLPNKTGYWRPGLFVTGEVAVDAEEVPIVIPSKAVAQLDEEKNVFVQAEGGFKAVPVKTGRSNRTHVEIVSGLKLGQTYVADGAFVVKAQAQKFNFDPHAGHNH
jgi:membrane fusion protein, heavy metal efflux system